MPFKGKQKVPVMSMAMTAELVADALVVAIRRRAKTSALLPPTANARICPDMKATCGRVQTRVWSGARLLHRNRAGD